MIRCPGLLFRAAPPGAFSRPIGSNIIPPSFFILRRANAPLPRPVFPGGPTVGLFPPHRFKNHTAILFRPPPGKCSASPAYLSGRPRRGPFPVPSVQKSYRPSFFVLRRANAPLPRPVFPGGSAGMATPTPAFSRPIGSNITPQALFSRCCPGSIRIAGPLPVGRRDLFGKDRRVAQHGAVPLTNVGKTGGKGDDRPHAGNVQLPGRGLPHQRLQGGILGLGVLPVKYPLCPDDPLCDPQVLMDRPVLRAVGGGNAGLGRHRDPLRVVRKGKGLIAHYFHASAPLSIQRLAAAVHLRGQPQLSALQRRKLGLQRGRILQYHLGHRPAFGYFRRFFPPQRGLPLRHPHSRCHRPCLLLHGCSSFPGLSLPGPFPAAPAAFGGLPPDGGGGLRPPGAAGPLPCTCPGFRCRLGPGAGRQRCPLPDQRPAGRLLHSGPFAAGVLYRLPVSCNFYAEITHCIKIRRLLPLDLLQLQGVRHRPRQKDKRLGAAVGAYRRHRPAGFHLIPGGVGQYRPARLNGDPPQGMNDLVHASSSSLGVSASVQYTVSRPRLPKAPHPRKKPVSAQASPATPQGKSPLAVSAESCSESSSAASMLSRCSTVSRSPTSSSRGALPGRAVSLRFTLWSLITSVVTPGVSGRRTVGILYRISHPGRCGAR
nr:MAG TPA: hypothetical protein [Caudoviricetes sp.]